MHWNRAILVLVFLALIPLGYAGNPDTLNQIVLIDSVIVTGNKTTREHIIQRELMVQPGDTLPRSALRLRLQQSRNNLLNISLFNFVTIQIIEKDSARVSVLVNVTERWYIWPYPIFEIADRNFNTWWKTRDLGRLNYGINLVWNNFRGRRESLSIYSRLGYNHKISMDYIIPYIDRNQKTGLAFGFSLGGTHEATARTDSLNEVVFVKDEKEYIKTETEAWLALTYRRSFFVTHTLGVFFTRYNADSILQMANPVYGPPDLALLSVLYQLKTDHRDYKHYPLKGWYADGMFRKDWGMGNSSNIKHWQAEMNLRYFNKITNRLYSALGFYTSFSSATPPPYPLMSGLGYGRYFVRGYEYYVIEGFRQYLAKANLKYELVPIRTYELRPFRSYKFRKTYYAFYLNVFADAGYAEQWPGMPATLLNNRVLYSTGIGIDFMTYYDKVFRVEYSVNHMGEGGVYIHFISSI